MNNINEFIYLIFTYHLDRITESDPEIILVLNGYKKYIISNKKIKNRLELRIFEEYAG